MALHGAEIAYMAEEPTIENSSTMTITKSQITSNSVIDREDLDGDEFGFAVHINDGRSPTWYLRAESVREKKSWLMRLAHVHAIVRWLEDFEKVRVLGVGGTGIVYELLHKSNGKRYAMKEMEIKSKAQMKMAISEAEMLKEIMENISHPNIMHIDKVFQVGSKFYLVFPLCTGGELYDHVIRRGHFNEYDAAKLIKALVSGLHSLHSHDILHLDIKPENILFESDDDNAPIKITDFGLSRVFVEHAGALSSSSGGASGERRRGSDPSSHRIPTMAEMEERLRAFQESGVLNRDKLRGTVGYMSPELILTGCSSKATDVFAAGVVLYILLCGRPPFQSKSNREILERTARGQYSMRGEEWEGVSDSAKDLVRKMLVIDPSKRISTTDILNHPWLNIDEDEEGEEVERAKEVGEEAKGDKDKDKDKDKEKEQAKAGNQASNTLKDQTRKFTGPKKSSNSLTHAMRLLSGHVGERKNDKLVANLTRLISSMQTSGTEGNSTLLKVIKQANGDPIPLQAYEESTRLLLDPDVKAALASVFSSLGGEKGRLSIDQFIAVMRYILNGSTAPMTPTSSSDSLSLAAGDASASASEGVDQESNAAPLSLPSSVSTSSTASLSSSSNTSTTSSSAATMPPISPSPVSPTSLGPAALVFCLFVDRDGDGMVSADDLITTQALIMQRSEVFVRAIFRMYCEALWYPGRQLNLLNMKRNATLSPRRPPGAASTRGASTGGGGSMLDEMPRSSVVEPPKFITHRHVSALFERLGLDPQNGAYVFNVLCEALARKNRPREDTFGVGGSQDADDAEVALVDEVRASIRDISMGSAASSPPSSPSPAMKSSTSSGTLPSSITSLPPSVLSPPSPISFASPPRTPSSSSNNLLSSSSSSAALSSAAVAGAASPGASASAHRMDVTAFIQAAELDDVLIQAILTKPRRSLGDLIKRATQPQPSVAADETSSPSSSSSSSSSTSEAARTYAHLIEKELATVLKTADEDAKAKFPIAAAIGRASIGAAVGLVTNITLGAQAILENFQDRDD